jgi:hypothetical protein
MNSKLSPVLVLLVLTAWVSAELPRKAPLTKYRNLWDNSPFTTKPPTDVGGPPPPSILDDYALAGVSPIKGGYRVTIINKKNPDDRVYVYSDQPNASHGFKIESVERKAGDMRGTVVHMMSGTQKGVVSYDEKFLTIAAPAPAPTRQAADRAKGREGGVVRPGGGNAVPAAPAQPGAANPAASPRAPRPRVIGPPPAPQVRTNDGTTPPPSGQRELRR